MTKQAFIALLVKCGFSRKDALLRARVIYGR
jgi:hypothetical protein